MSDSSSSTTSFFLILLLLGGGVWLIKDTLDPAPKPAPPAAPEEEATSLPTRALDASKTSGDSLNNSMNDQLKSVQGMVGGTYDGQTYVPPQGKK